jgi:hypothetical protein
MKNITILFFAILVVVFVSCDKKDTISPDVLILGDGGVYLASGETDTTVLLFSKLLILDLKRRII